MEPINRRRGSRRPLPEKALEESPNESTWADPDRISVEEPPDDIKRRASLWVRLVWVVAGLVFLSCGAAGVGAYWLVQRYSKNLPSVATLKAGYEPPQVTRIYARDETLLASLFTERRTVVAFEQIPDSAKLAFLAAEDAHFYEHEGLNYFGMARALVANVRAGKTVQGGSTITQQVVKNVLLDPRRTLARKVRELLLTRRLEQSLPKDEILWLYLNHIYLGHGRYGIEEAARYYFGVHASQLTLDQSATLAGLVAAPERYSPRKNPRLALKRRRYVLGQMLKKGFVTPDLHSQIVDRALRLAPTEETESKLVPEMVERAKRELKKALPEQAGRGGFSVYTTIDPTLQAAARKALRSNLDAYMARHKLAPPYGPKLHSLWAQPMIEGKPKRYRIYTGVVRAVDDRAGTLDVSVGSWVGQVALSEQPRYNSKHLPPSKFAPKGALLRVSFDTAPSEGVKGRARLELGPQSALVALDARTREVLALVGSYEAVTGGLDRATQARRQPGSTFKSLLYSYGLHSRKITAATPIPVSHRGHGVPETGPRQLSVRAALAHSNNQAATSTLRRLGAAAVVDWAHQLGIESKLEADVSLALGAYEVSPLELANSYVPFANGGRSGSPKFFSRVTGPEGKAVLLPKADPTRAIMTPEEAYLTTTLLRSVITDGTAKRALRLGRDAAGKTGTTNQEKDAWFVGYTTDIVAAIWVGYDDARPLGRGESGAKAALPAWIEFMKAAHKGRPPTRFARPSGILSVTIDPQTGLLPAPNQENTIVEEFLSGTEPLQQAQLILDAGAG